VISNASVATHLRYSLASVLVARKTLLSAISKGDGTLNYGIVMATTAVIINLCLMLAVNAVTATYSFALGSKMATNVQGVNSINIEA